MLDRVLTIAILVEVITNFFKYVNPQLEKRLLPILAGLVGVVLAWTTETSILTALEIPVKSITVDYLVTGIIISRGANIVHDVAKKVNF